MKKFMILFLSFVLFSFVGTSFAQNLNLTFEDASDITNWSHFDETNFFTVEAHNPTAGVDGSGALQLTDGGFDFIAKRAINATLGSGYSLSMDVKTGRWDDVENYPIYVTVQGIDSDPDTIYINNSTEYNSIELSGVATGETGYIRIYGANNAGQDTVLVDNVAYVDSGYVPMVNVTFRVNSSTVEGIVDSTGAVDLRGTVTQWGPGTDLTSVGGDYWEITIPLAASTGYEYKYGARTTTLTGVLEWWENDIPGASYSGPNRSFTTGTEDMTLDLDWLGGGPDNNFPPYTPTDSIDVYFRVNMGALNGFNPVTTNIYMVGEFPAVDGEANMWNPNRYQLMREHASSDYYGYHLRLATAIDSAHYRFTQGDWGNSEGVYGHGMFPDNENRGVSIGSNDTTIVWVWWNDNPPALAGNDTVDVTFRADLGRAFDENGFNLGDTLLVKWGYNNTALFGTDTMVNELGLDYYSVTVEVTNLALGENVNYQYHKIVNGNDVEEVFFDFDEVESGSPQKSRKIAIPAIKPLDPVVTDDDVDSNTDIHRRPRFRNTSRLSQPVLVTFSCDIRPAYFTVLNGVTIFDIQGDLEITVPDTVISWGVAINGPATVGGWGNDQGADWGRHVMNIEGKAMFDDGTHGDDVAGDSIYTMQVLHSPDSSARFSIGTEFKFGIGGADDEAGGEQGYGLNHIENIDDETGAFTIHSEFGSINPNYYIGWDFDTSEPIITALGDNVEILNAYRLDQNYPNPFNPNTVIKLNLHKPMHVKLVIYDITGKEVRTLVDRTLRNEIHSFQWNATDNRGNRVSTGVYFYRLEADGHVQTKKMVLMK